MPLTGGYTQIVTAPTAIALSLTEAKRQLRLSDDDDDALLVDYLHACRQFCETAIPGGMTLLTTTLDLKLPAFPSGRERLYLPGPPLASITSATYYDTDGVAQTLTENTDFIVHRPATGQGWLVPMPGVDWPADAQDERDDAVTVRFVAGYTQATLPPQLKQAIRLALGGFFEFRESMNPGSVSELPIGTRLLLQNMDYGFYG